jgi:tetratricopeptide (TPR) repeat protein
MAGEYVPACEQISSTMIGKTLGHYRIIEKIGAGGMGEIYRAHDEQLDRDVALKVLPAGTLADEAARKQFRKEALALAKLNHPNIETVFEFNTQDGVDFLAMELIAGSSLSEKVKAEPLPQKEIVRLGMQLAEGLAAAHGQGVVHRDLKPSNLMITPDGRLKILDFGLAKLVHQDLGNDLTRSITMETGTISGTVPYMPPEQLRGLPVDARADIYAAGAVLYEMATGRRPFPQTQGAELMGAILHQPPPTPSSLNARIALGLESVILKALEKEASQRYQSAREVLVALEGISFSAVAPTTAAAPATSVVMPTATAGPPPSVAKVTRSGWLLISGVAVVVAALAAGAYFYFHRASRLTEKDTIVLADFTNTTGDPVFDDTLRQGLTVQLEQSPFLSLVSDQRIQETLRLMGQSADARLTPEIARDLCQRAGSKAYLSGSIASLGSQFVLGLNAVNCQTGDPLAEEQERATGKEQVLAAMDKAASKLRAKLGESLTTVQKLDTPLEQATTPSLDALQAYSLGRKTLVEKDDPAAAVPFFQRAIRLDPNFAMAYASLGVGYHHLGETSLAAENTRKAYELRERVTEREKFYVESHYHGYVTGDLEKGRQVYELWAQTYPRDDLPTFNLGGTYWLLGQYDKSLAQFREGLRLDPGSGLSYANLASAYLYLDRMKEARATVEDALSKNVDSSNMRFSLYQVAFLQNDLAGMAQQVAWSAGKRGVEDVLLAFEADTAAYSGRLGKARELSRRAVASADRAEEKEVAAGYEAVAALREALFGNAAEARQWAAASLALSHGQGVQYGAALALALAGDAARAQAVTDDLAKRFADDTLVQFNWLPTLHAEVALTRNNSSKAIEALQTAIPYELGCPFWLPLYPVYVRGEAYLAASRPGGSSEATAEFQKILDHRGVVGNEPIGALAHLGLARAYALQGETTKSRTAYQDFLTLWKDADPDIPILRAAKAEYAKLK